MKGVISPNDIANSKELMEKLEIEINNADLDI